MTLEASLHSLQPGAIVELYELDSTAIGGSITRLHAGTNSLRTAVIWQGNEYTPFPIEASGFEFSGKGTLPRPTVKVANVTGLIGALVRELDDLMGAKFTRKRTLVKFLDAVNFPGGVNPTADPSAHLPDDVYYVDRKVGESKLMVEFELAASFDVAGVMLPRRYVVQNVCPWAYRGADCGYTGTNYYDTNDVAVGTLAEDACGKRLVSCKLRFGDAQPLSYGGFPAAGLTK